jgi:hypothetical protein
MKRASDVPLMMQGTPCSRGNHSSLKASSKTHYVTGSTNPAKRVRVWVAKRNSKQVLYFSQ